MIIKWFKNLMREHKERKKESLIQCSLEQLLTTIVEGADYHFFYPISTNAFKVPENFDLRYKDYLITWREVKIANKIVVRIMKKKSESEAYESVFIDFTRGSGHFDDEMIENYQNLLISRAKRVVEIRKIEEKQESFNKIEKFLKL